jgi:tetratricopeptide (TPR) repeat protein
VGADEAAVGIAVVPFGVTGGEELDLWREGMVDLLATNLDGVAGYRTIDSRTVMAQWRKEVPGEETPDLRTSLEVAARTGARYALVGNLVGNPAGIRLSADLYDLSTGQEVAQVSQEGSADNVLGLTSALSVDLTREMLGSDPGQAAVQERRLDGLTTNSLPALRAYLAGEAAFRRANFASAVAEYEEAVLLDPLFALAWLRLSQAHGWLEDVGSEAGARAGEQALELIDRLPARDQILVRASEASRTGDPSFLQGARDGVRRYPDDPDLWFELGEVIYHTAMGRGLASMEQARDAFDQAVALDPGFGPYRVHQMELLITTGDRAAAEAALEEYRSSTEDAKNIAEFELVIPLLFGTDEESAEAVARSLQLDMSVMNQIRVTFLNRSDRYDRLTDLNWANKDRPGAQQQWIFFNLGAQGELERAGRMTDTLDLTASTKTLGAGWMMGNWSTLPTSLADLARPEHCEQPALDTQCLMFLGWGQATSGDLDGARETLGRIRYWAGEAEEGAAEVRNQFGDLIEGTIAVREERASDARSILAPVAAGGGNQGALARKVLGALEAQEGNYAEAIRHHTGNLLNYERARTSLELGRIYEQRGDPEEARVHYGRFVRITDRGDEGLAEIVEAREALARLGG